MDLYEIVRGPLAWVALLVFFLGTGYRIVSMLVEARKDKVVYPYMSLKYGLRSLMHWMIPFGSVNMRKRPVMTVVTFVFHICLVLTPIFLLAHIVLVYESWQVQWCSLPERATDVMSVLVVLACVFFLVRRIVSPEVQNVTFLSDYVLLALVLLPFLTGFLAYHQMGPYRPMLILHILTGEIMLVAIPFTRLSHMFFFFFTRAYMGSEFGNVRNARDW
ncbi:MAG: TmcC family electron transfer complex membrane anchor subunit [Thermodesulfobacteriota bacterium]